MPRLALCLLGPPRIEREGVAIKLDRRKAIALLAFLAVTGRDHRRDSLFNLLWPDFDSLQGRAALRRTLHALSSALGSDCLDADREAIGFQPDRDLWVDVLHFRACLEECTTHGHPPAEICPTSAALLAEAVTLVQGEFLSGLGLKDSLNFDDWQIIQAETVRQELAGAFERLVRRHSGQREFETALAYARRQLALDPLDESAHRQIMCLDTWSGRRPAALRQFDECVALLRDQLDVPPQEATRQLYADLQSGGVPPLPTTPDLVAELPPFLKGDLAVERPVFARERDLAQMDRYLDGALGGRGQMVFVTGDAGSS